MQEPLTLVFDTKSPVLENTKLTGSNEAIVNDKTWFKDKVTVTANVNNVAQEFAGVTYKTKIVGVSYKAIDGSVEGQATYNSENHSYTFEINTPDKTTYSKTFEVWAVDEAGNKSVVEQVSINIDKVNPTLIDEETAVTFEQIENNLLQQMINFLSFGTFF